MTKFSSCQGYAVTMSIATVGFVAACRLMLYTEQSPSAWLHFAGCGVLGIITAYCFVWIAQYYTDYKYKPVKVLAEASTTGHGTNIIAGVSLVSHPS